MDDPAAGSRPAPTARPRRTDRGGALSAAGPSDPAGCAGTTATGPTGSPSTGSSPCLPGLPGRREPDPAPISIAAAPGPAPPDGSRPHPLRPQDPIRPLARNRPPRTGGPDPAELVRAMERLGPYLRLLAGRAPGSDPEDLGQETAARALRLGGSLRPGAPLVPWLRRIALRVHLDALARRRPEVEFHDGVPEPRVEDPTLGLEERERCEVLLARLAAREREVLERFHRREHSIARIASDLCLPEGTVKSLLHRARRRLAASDPPSRP